MLHIIVVENQKEGVVQRDVSYWEGKLDNTYTMAWIYRYS